MGSFAIKIIISNHSLKKFWKNVTTDRKSVFLDISKSKIHILSTKYEQTDLKTAIVALVSHKLWLRVSSLLEHTHACSICLFKFFLTTVELFLTRSKCFDHSQNILPMQNFWNLGQKVLNLSKNFWTYPKLFDHGKKIWKQSKKLEPADGIGIIG